MNVPVFDRGYKDDPADIAFAAIKEVKEGLLILRLRKNKLKLY